MIAMGRGGSVRFCTRHSPAACQGDRAYEDDDLEASEADPGQQPTYGYVLYASPGP